MLNSIWIVFRAHVIELVVIVLQGKGWLLTCPSALTIWKENCPIAKWYSFSFFHLLFRLLSALAPWAITHLPLLTSFYDDLVLDERIGQLRHQLCIHAHLLSLPGDARDAAKMRWWYFCLLFCAASNCSIISLLRSRLLLIQVFRGYYSTSMLLDDLPLVLCLTLLDLLGNSRSFALFLPLCR